MPKASVSNARQQDTKNSANGLWISWTIFIALMASTALNQTWPWGLYFLLATIQSVRSGYVHMFTLVRRDESPISFWIFSIAWLGLSLMLLLSPWLYPS